MTISCTSVLLDYCSFYITGVEGVRVPVDQDGDGVTATDDCINVSPLPWNEGEMAITLAASAELPAQARLPRFDGILDTPKHRAFLSDANEPKMLVMAVPEVRTRVRIWTNHKTRPDDVIIALG